MYYIWNIVPKGEKAHHEQFLFMPKCFQKSSPADKNLENLYKKKADVLKRVGTLCQKEKKLIISNFFSCHNVFKSRLLQFFEGTY